MANTFSSLHYHFIFSTKNREPWIKREIEERLWAYLGGIASRHDLKPILIGGMEDHVHLLVGMPPTITISEALKYIIGASSGWIKQSLPGCGSFAWQDGYGAFTVSKSLVSGVQDYIRRQREHHRQKSFREEYVAFLKKHGINYDDRYLLD